MVGHQIMSASATTATGGQLLQPQQQPQRGSSRRRHGTAGPALMLLLLQLLLVVLLGCGVQAFLLPAAPSAATTTTTAPPPAHRCGYYPSAGAAAGGRAQPASWQLQGGGGGGGGDYGRWEERSKRQLRVARVLQSTIADVIRKGYPIKTKDILDDRIRAKISVVDVDCSPDLRSARVEVSIFGETVEKREAFIWLVNNAKAIRHALAQEMRDFRHTPQLFFRQGDLGAGSDMFSLLDKLGEARMAGGRAVVLEEEGDEYEEWEEEEEEEDEWAEGKYEDEEEEEDEDDFEWEEEDDDEEDGPPLGLAAQQAKDQQDAERLIAMLGGLEAAAGGPGGAGGGKGLKPKPKPKPRVDLGSGGLGRRQPGWAPSQPYQPGAIEAELAREIEKLRSVQESGGELEGDVWGDEDDDEEEEEEEEEDDDDDDDDDELWEEDEAGEHTGDDESLVDWPVEEEPEDYSALLSDGWVDMDSILDQASGVGEEDIDALLRALDGMPSDGGGGGDDDDEGEGK